MLICRKLCINKGVLAKKRILFGFICQTNAHLSFEYLLFTGFSLSMVVYLDLLENI